MATPLADVASLEARLGRTLEGPEIPMAEAALDDASAMVRAYGLPWPDPATAPATAISVTLAAAERKLRNPEGYRQEMEGGYQYAFAASMPTGVDLKPSEIRLLQAVAGVSGLFSVQFESFGGAV
ncbi:hypothetical protein [Streptomyces sp. NPDC101393]|uniref:hypothetical protein n=1 Tax=Streptomyces sp. NPDC101393 TaxID=3366141 RepID=UPI0037F3788F